MTAPQVAGLAAAGWLLSSFILVALIARWGVNRKRTAHPASRHGRHCR